VNTVDDLKKYVNKNKIVYNDIKAIQLVILYKGTCEEAYLFRIRELCFPLILGSLKYFNKKNKRKFKIVDTQELIGEAILIIDDCVKSYDLKLKIKFSSFVMTSMIRRFVRIVKYIDNNISPTVKGKFYTIEELYTDYNNTECNITKTDDIIKISEKSFEDKIDFKQMVRELKSELNKKEKKVYNLLLRGATKQNILLRANINRDEFKEILNKIKLFLLNELKN